MSQGITQSIKLTAKLVDILTSQFGTAVKEIAEKIAPNEVRHQWLTFKAEDAINTYIKNMGFTVNFLEIVRKQFGDSVVKITSDLIAQEERIRWCSVASQEKDHSIENFIKLLWEPLAPLGFKYTVEHHKEGSQITCTSCPIHELSKMIGGAEWLAVLECGKDLNNVEGFNSNIGCKRTKTLMKGDSHCDHFYYNKE